MNLSDLFGAGVDPDLMLLALPIFGAILLFGLALTGRGERKTLKRRVERVRTGRGPGASVSRQVSLKRSTRDSNIPLLDRFIKEALPQREVLRRRLLRAGLSASIGSYLTANLVVGILCFAVVAWSGMVPLIAAGLAGVVGGLGLPHAWLALLAKRRQARFIANFPEAIDLMSRGLKSGLPITESIKTAGEEIADPVGSELRRVTEGVRLGRKLDEVLWETSQNLDLQEFKFFTISLSIQSETGGNLTETLGNLSDVLRRRRQLKLKIRALSGEAKASAYIIGSLPFVMTGIIYMMNPSYLEPLVTDLRGQVLVGLGLSSFVVGALVMFKMVRFEI